jgi:hypothetical protein
MKRFFWSLLATLTATALIAGTPPGANIGTGFDKVKDLVGSWKGTDAKGTGIDVSYKLVSADHTIMETLDFEGKKENMVTMYHLDGNRTMLTHYCSMGNQPRMALDRKKSSGDRLAFSFIDATNLKSKSDAHMHRLTLVFKDKDHFAQEWTMSANGKEQTETFNFERVKE